VVLRFGADADADFLLAPSGIGEDVVGDDQIVVFADDINADAVAFRAVVADEAFVDGVAVGAKEFVAFIAEVDAYAGVSVDGAADDAIVGIAVAEVDAVLPVVTEDAVFDEGVGDAPAKEEAFIAESADAVAKDRSLRP